MRVDVIKNETREASIYGEKESEENILKKRTLLFSNLIVVLFIILGFMGVLYKDTRAYQELSERHLESIVKLAGSDIYKHIESSMSKPVMVSRTMANDSFLKEWLEQEPENTSDEAYMEKLYGYLGNYQKEYAYTTVFCVSTVTGNYYYQDGLNKTVSQEDEHDVWYYNFVDSGKEYDLEVDTNEANADMLSVFVNFRVENEEGALLGVIGVGLLVSSVEETMRSYENDYDLEVYIINVGGVDNSFTGATDIFIKEDTLQEVTGIKDNIELNETETSALQWFTAGAERKCLITKYDEVLGWYLILEKDTGSISHVFRERLINNILNLLMSLTACIFATSIVFFGYNKIVIRMENTDDLTGLPNRKLFRKQRLEQMNKKETATLFIFDIDNFKIINDTKGHMFGNAVLAMVGETIQKTIAGKGFASRWGGDEFFGILSTNKEEAHELLQNFMKTIAEDGDKMNQAITVSIGIVEVNHSLTLDQMFEQADEALYRSKKNGRNQITTL